MNISVFGLGYVGCVSAGCLAKLGNNVIGVDVIEEKVDLINNGKGTVVENGIDELIVFGIDNGTIKATLEAGYALNNSEIAIIAVGTPNNEAGQLNMDMIYATAKEIGKNLKNKNDFFTIAIRSTVMPGTNQKVREIISKEAGHENFGVVSNPEFLREGSAIEDFFNPPYTVLASESELALKKMKNLYKQINSTLLVVDVINAELIKFVNNSFHALKVGFANEIGRISKHLGADSRQLMELFVSDKLLNISPYYFKPGFAYGGSCLPKDLKALNTISHDNYLVTPILNSVSVSNKAHIEHAYELIHKYNKRSIGFFGISFKPGTDDLRFSPSIELVERLLGKGFFIKVFDENVNLSRIMGKNKDYLYSKLPHVSELLCNSIEDFIDTLEILVISTKSTKLEELFSKLNHSIIIIDLVDAVKNSSKQNYTGICW